MMRIETLLSIAYRYVAATLACLFFFATHADAQVDTQLRAVPPVVNLKAFAAADGDDLHLLMRVPLSSVKNVQFPERTSGYLDVAALQSMAPSLARHCVAETLRVEAKNDALAQPATVATRISIISDPSFNSYKSALERFASPDLAVDEQVLWQQVWLDVHFLYAGGAVIALEPHVANLGVKVTTELTIVDAKGERQLTFEGNPGRIYLSPRFHEVLGQFVAHGLRAVWTNADFVVFLLCFALPFRQYKDIAPATVAFASAVIVGLLALRVGFIPNNLWFQSLIDTLAAVAVVLIAAANIVNRVSPRSRALFAIAAGLVFGALSAFRFEPIDQFAGGHAVVGGLGYVIGILLAIALAVAVLIPLFKQLFAFARAEPIERIIVSALAADTAWTWVSDRYSQFARVPSMFAFEAGTAKTIVSSLVFVAALVAVLWFVNRRLKLRDPLEGTSA